WGRQASCATKFRAACGTFARNRSIAVGVAAYDALPDVAFFCALSGGGVARSAAFILLLPGLGFWSLQEEHGRRSTGFVRGFTRFRQLGYLRETPGFATP